MSGSPARPASTVVLIRPTQASFEVLLLKRHDKVAFMGGAHVFPGGRVDEADRLADPERICDGVTEAISRMPDLERTDAVGHCVAAIRELFEEAGVLLARPMDATRARELRSQMAAGVSIDVLARREGFRLALDSLAMFAHWVTPEIEIRRYDTRFFLARMPEGQIAKHDESETTALEWLSPREAIARFNRRELLLPPPTYTSIRQLAPRASIDDVFAWAKPRRIARVMPGFFKNGDEATLTLPGDPLFPTIPDWDVPEETRFVLQDGARWQPSKA